MNKIIVICGPTASGKTKFAHLLAKNNNGEIVNADSMQLYKGLSILTSSPSRELTSELPYHLYNFLEIGSDFSVAKYASYAAKKIQEITMRGKLPILVGGSGMYINALIYGFSDIPEITQKIRTSVRTLAEFLDPKDFFRFFKQIDPKTASGLNNQDAQRASRALEVYLQTGKSILDYHQSNHKLLQDFEFEVIMLLPQREFLYSMCNERLSWMFKHGAIEEAALLIPIKTQAIGFSQIVDYLDGKISKLEALEIAQAKTRQYAKRQITWFKNQIKNKKILEFSNNIEYNSILDKYSRF